MDGAEEHDVNRNKPDWETQVTWFLSYDREVKGDVEVGAGGGDYEEREMESGKGERERD